MKRISLLLMLFVSLSYSQKIISIDTVFVIEDTSKEVLYNRMHTYLTKFLNNQKQKEYLFKVEEKEGGIIKVERSFKHKTKGLVASGLINVRAEYVYELYFKDNKMRLVVEYFTHPYFGVASDELPYPKDSKPSMTGKKWYAKVYKEFVINVKANKILIIATTQNAINIKDKSEEDW